MGLKPDHKVAFVMGVQKPENEGAVGRSRG